MSPAIRAEHHRASYVFQLRNDLILNMLVSSSSTQLQLLVQAQPPTRPVPQFRFFRREYTIGVRKMTLPPSVRTES